MLLACIAAVSTRRCPLRQCACHRRPSAQHTWTTTSWLSSAVAKQADGTTESAVWRAKAPGCAGRQTPANGLSVSPFHRLLLCLAKSNLGSCWQAAGRGAGGVPAQPVLHAAADSLRALAAARVPGQAAAGAAAHRPAGDLAPGGCCCLWPQQGLMAAVQAGSWCVHIQTWPEGAREASATARELCRDLITGRSGPVDTLPLASLDPAHWLDSIPGLRVHQTSVRIKVHETWAAGHSTTLLRRL